MVRIRISARLAGLVTAGATALLFLGSPAGAVAGTSAMDLRTHGSGHTAGSAGNLVYNGGRVLASSNTYAIWWGSASAWPSDVQSGMGTFFSGLAGTSFLNTAAQYMFNANTTSAFKGSSFDSSSPPKHVSPSTLGNEVAKIYGTNVDPNGIYFVFTSNFPNSNYCAWHSYATVNGTNVAVAYMPNTNNVAGCNPGNLYGLSGSEGLRSLANVTSHEFMEAITDPFPSSGWVDSSGSEIGDKCAWQFQSAVTLKNGSTWQLQMEWSNSVSGCVQTT